MTLRQPSPPARQHPLVRAFEAALARIDLEVLVHDALPPLPPARARVRVVAIGKASPAMAAGALRRWPHRIERVLVVAPDGTPEGRLQLPAQGAGDGRVVVLRASHPVPDERSVVAAETALALAAGEARDLLVVLVSGGASALACAPCPGVTLARKQECVRALLASGARIDEINTVRRHLSRIKGGGLTRAASPGRVLALLASDVVEGNAWDIGSGPTVPDPTTTEDARLLLERWAPGLPSLPLVETLRPTDPIARRQRARVVVSPDDLARAVAAVLRAEGYSVRILPASTEGVDDLVAEYARAASELLPGTALVRAAEPSLRVPGESLAEGGRAGRGGRSGHLGARVAQVLPPGVTFLAAGSDGVDGSSGAAGVVVDGELATRVAGGWPAVEASLAAFDTASLHEAAGSAIVLGPTGKNLADIHVLARI